MLDVVEWTEFSGYVIVTYDVAAAEMPYIAQPRCQADERLVRCIVEFS